MKITIHWQDADSSSAKAVTEIFPKAEIMICGGHAGRAHKKILQSRQKLKTFTNRMISKYEDRFPALKDLSCKCKGNHSASCGCLTAAFIGKAHTNFTSILMESQSQGEFVRRVLNMHRISMSGRGESVIFTLCVYAHVVHVRTKTR